METSLAVEEGGFALRDIRVTYEIRKIVNRTSQSVSIKEGMAVRAFTPADLPAIEQLAAEAHGDTRFFYDAAFPREAVRRLYQVWIRQSCFSRTGTVLVLGSKYEIAGYLSCETDKEGNGRIGLVAVDPAYRGRGFGAILLEAGLAWFAGKGVQNVTVVTQGRNIAAQRLYQRAGFFITGAEAWHHKWFTETPSHGRNQDSV